MVKQKRFCYLSADKDLLKFRAGFVCRLLSFGRTNGRIEIPLNTVCRYKIARSFPGCRLLTLYIRELTPAGERILRLQPINTTFVTKSNWGKLLLLLEGQVSAKATDHVKLRGFHKIPA